MHELIERTKAKNKTKAIDIAIIDYLEKKSIEDLIALNGKIRIDLDWEKEEEAELEEYKNRR